MAFTRFLTSLLLGAACAKASHLEAKLYATSPRALTVYGEDMQTENAQYFTFNGAIPWYPYSMDVGVGTPAQTQSMALTVQHGESWILWDEHCLPRDINPNRTAYYRNCSSGSFDDTKSPTFGYNETGRYYGSYGWGREAGVEGRVMQDTVRIGEAEWGNATMAIGTATLLDTGFFGLGRPWLYANYKLATGSGQATMLDQMVEHKVVNTPAFSIYANNELLNSTEARQEVGKILFGAVDKGKYNGPLKRIQASAARDKFSRKDERAPGYVANVTGFWTKDAAGKERSVGASPMYAVVDPAFAISNVPSSVATELYRLMDDVWYLSYVNFKGYPCELISNLTGSFSVELGGAGGYRLEVPLRDLVVPPEVFHMVLSDKWEGRVGRKLCLIAVQEAVRSNSYFYYDYENMATEWVIGSMMLQNTYAVFDSENMEISMAPLKAEGGTADIVEFDQVGAHAPDSEFVGYEECFVESCKKEEEDKKNGGSQIGLHMGLLAVSTVAMLSYVLQ